MCQTDGKNHEILTTSGLKILRLHLGCKQLNLTTNWHSHQQNYVHNSVS